jgi:hypothetical protein
MNQVNIRPELRDASLLKTPQNDANHASFSGFDLDRWIASRSETAEDNVGLSLQSPIEDQNLRLVLSSFIEELYPRDTDDSKHQGALLSSWIKGNVVDFDESDRRVIGTFLSRVTSPDNFHKLALTPNQITALQDLQSSVALETGSSMHIPLEKAKEIRASLRKNAGISDQEQRFRDRQYLINPDHAMIREMAQSLPIFSSHSDEEVATHVVEYVKENFSYIEDDRCQKDYCDHWQSIDETLLKGGGDCEDLSILITSLLSHVYLERGHSKEKVSHMVMLSAGYLLTESGGKLGHSLVKLQLKDAPVMYLDSTSDKGVLSTLDIAYEEVLEMNHRHFATHQPVDEFFETAVSMSIFLKDPTRYGVNQGSGPGQVEGAFDDPENMEAYLANKDTLLWQINHEMSVISELGKKEYDIPALYDGTLYRKLSYQETDEGTLKTESYNTGLEEKEYAVKIGDFLRGWKLRSNGKDILEYKGSTIALSDIIDNEGNTLTLDNVNASVTDYLDEYNNALDRLNEIDNKNSPAYTEGYTNLIASKKKFPQVFISIGEHSGGSHVSFKYSSDQKDVDNVDKYTYEGSFYDVVTFKKNDMDVDAVTNIQTIRFRPDKFLEITMGIRQHMNRLQLYISLAKALIDKRNEVAWQIHDTTLDDSAKRDAQSSRDKGEKNVDISAKLDQFQTNIATGVNQLSSDLQTFISTANESIFSRKELYIEEFGRDTDIAEDNPIFDFLATTGLSAISNIADEFTGLFTLYRAQAKELLNYIRVDTAMHNADAFSKYSLYVINGMPDKDKDENDETIFGAFQTKGIALWGTEEQKSLFYNNNLITDIPSRGQDEGSNFDKQTLIDHLKVMRMKNSLETIFQNVKNKGDITPSTLFKNASPNKQEDTSGSTVIPFPRDAIMDSTIHSESSWFTDEFLKIIKTFTPSNPLNDFASPPFQSFLDYNIETQVEFRKKLVRYQNHMQLSLMIQQLILDEKLKAAKEIGDVRKTSAIANAKKSMSSAFEIELNRASSALSEAHKHLNEFTLSVNQYKQSQLDLYRAEQLRTLKLVTSGMYTTGFLTNTPITSLVMTALSPLAAFSPFFAANYMNPQYISLVIETMTNNYISSVKSTFSKDIYKDSAVYNNPEILQHSKESKYTEDSVTDSMSTLERSISEAKTNENTRQVITASIDHLTLKNRKAYVTTSDLKINNDDDNNLLLSDVPDTVKNRGDNTLVPNALLIAFNQQNTLYSQRVIRFYILILKAIYDAIENELVYMFNREKPQAFHRLEGFFERELENENALISDLKTEATSTYLSAMSSNINQERELFEKSFDETFRLVDYLLVPTLLPGQFVGKAAYIGASTSSSETESKLDIFSSPFRGQLSQHHSLDSQATLDRRESVAQKQSDIDPTHKGSSTPHIPFRPKNTHFSKDYTAFISDTNVVTTFSDSGFHDPKYDNLRGNLPYKGKTTFDDPDEKKVFIDKAKRILPWQYFEEKERDLFHQLANEDVNNHKKNIYVEDMYNVDFSGDFKQMNYFKTSESYNQLIHISTLRMIFSMIEQALYASRQNVLKEMFYVSSSANIMESLMSTVDTHNNAQAEIFESLLEELKIITESKNIETQWNVSKEIDLASSAVMIAYHTGSISFGLLTGSSLIKSSMKGFRNATDVKQLVAVSGKLGVGIAQLLSQNKLSAASSENKLTVESDSDDSTDMEGLRKSQQTIENPEKAINDYMEESLQTIENMEKAINDYMEESLQNIENPEKANNDYMEKSLQTIENLEEANNEDMAKSLNSENIQTSIDGKSTISKAYLSRVTTKIKRRFRQIDMILKLILSLQEAKLNEISDITGVTPTSFKRILDISKKFENLQNKKANLHYEALKTEAEVKNRAISSVKSAISSGLAAWNQRLVNRKMEMQKAKNKLAEEKKRADEKGTSKRPDDRISGHSRNHWKLSDFWGVSQAQAGARTGAEIGSTAGARAGAWAGAKIGDTAGAWAGLAGARAGAWAGAGVGGLAGAGFALASAGARAGARAGLAAAGAWAGLAGAWAGARAGLAAAGAGARAGFRAARAGDWHEARAGFRAARDQARAGFRAARALWKKMPNSSYREKFLTFISLSAYFFVNVGLFVDSSLPNTQISQSEDMLVSDDSETTDEDGEFTSTDDLENALFMAQLFQSETDIRKLQLEGLKEISAVSKQLLTHAYKLNFSLKVNDLISRNPVSKRIRKSIEKIEAERDFFLSTLTEEQKKEAAAKSGSVRFLMTAITGQPDGLIAKPDDSWLIKRVKFFAKLGTSTIRAALLLPIVPSLAVFVALVTAISTLKNISSTLKNISQPLLNPVASAGKAVASKIVNTATSAYESLVPDNFKTGVKMSIKGIKTVAKILLFIPFIPYLLMNSAFQAGRYAMRAFGVNTSYDDDIQRSSWSHLLDKVFDSKDSRFSTKDPVLKDSFAADAYKSLNVGGRINSILQKDDLRFQKELRTSSDREKIQLSMRQIRDTRTLINHLRRMGQTDSYFADIEPVLFSHYVENITFSRVDTNKILEISKDILLQVPDDQKNTQEYKDAETSFATLASHTISTSLLRKFYDSTHPTSSTSASFNLTEKKKEVIKDFFHNYSDLKDDQKARVMAELDNRLDSLLKNQYLTDDDELTFYFPIIGDNSNFGETFSTFVKTIIKDDPTKSAIIAAPIIDEIKEIKARIAAEKLKGNPTAIDEIRLQTEIHSLRALVESIIDRTNLGIPQASPLLEDIIKKDRDVAITILGDMAKVRMDMDASSSGTKEREFYTSLITSFDSQGKAGLIASVLSESIVRTSPNKEAFKNLILPHLPASEILRQGKNGIGEYLNDEKITASKNQTYLGDIPDEKIETYESLVKRLEDLEEKLKSQITDDDEIKKLKRFITEVLVEDDPNRIAELERLLLKYAIQFDNDDLLSFLKLARNRLYGVPIADTENKEFFDFFDTVKSFTKIEALVSDSTQKRKFYSKNTTDGTLNLEKEKIEKIADIVKTGINSGSEILIKKSISILKSVILPGDDGIAQSDEIKRLFFEKYFENISELEKLSKAISISKDPDKDEIQRHIATGFALASLGPPPTQPGSASSGSSSANSGLRESDGMKSELSLVDLAKKNPHEAFRLIQVIVTPPDSSTSQTSTVITIEPEHFLFDFLTKIGSKNLKKSELQHILHLLNLLSTNLEKNTLLKDHIQRTAILKLIKNKQKLLEKELQEKTTSSVEFWKNRESVIEYIKKSDASNTDFLRALDSPQTMADNSVFLSQQLVSISDPTAKDALEHIIQGIDPAGISIQSIPENKQALLTSLNTGILHHYKKTNNAAINWTFESIKKIPSTNDLVDPLFHSALLEKATIYQYIDSKITSPELKDADLTCIKLLLGAFNGIDPTNLTITEDDLCAVLNSEHFKTYLKEPQYNGLYRRVLQSIDIFLNQAQRIDQGTFNAIRGTCIRAAFFNYDVPAVRNQALQTLSSAQNNLGAPVDRSDLEALSPPPLSDPLGYIHHPTQAIDVDNLDSLKAFLWYHSHKHRDFLNTRAYENYLSDMDKTYKIELDDYTMNTNPLSAYTLGIYYLENNVIPENCSDDVISEFLSLDYHPAMKQAEFKKAKVTLVLRKINDYLEKWPKLADAKQKMDTLLLIGSFLEILRQDNDSSITMKLLPKSDLSLYFNDIKSCLEMLTPDNTHFALSDADPNDLDSIKSNIDSFTFQSSTASSSRSLQPAASSDLIGINDFSDATSPSDINKLMKHYSSHSLFRDIKNAGKEEIQKKLSLLFNKASSQSSHTPLDIFTCALSVDTLRDYETQDLANFVELITHHLPEPSASGLLKVLMLKLNSEQQRAICDGLCAGLDKQDDATQIDPSKSLQLFLESMCPPRSSDGNTEDIASYLQLIASLKEDHKDNDKLQVVINQVFVRFIDEHADTILSNPDDSFVKNIKRLLGFDTNKTSLSNFLTHISSSSKNKDHLKKMMKSVIAVMSAKTSTLSSFFGSDFNFSSVADVTDKFVDNTQDSEDRKVFGQFLNVLIQTGIKNAYQNNMMRIKEVRSLVEKIYNKMIKEKTPLEQEVLQSFIGKGEFLSPSVIDSSDNYSMSLLPYMSAEDCTKFLTAFPDFAKNFILSPSTSTQLIIDVISLLDPDKPEEKKAIEALTKALKDYDMHHSFDALYGKDHLPSFPNPYLAKKDSRPSYLPDNPLRLAEVYHSLIEKMDQLGPNGEKAANTLLTMVDTSQGSFDLFSVNNAEIKILGLGTRDTAPGIPSPTSPSNNSDDFIRQLRLLLKSSTIDETTKRAFKSQTLTNPSIPQEHIITLLKKRLNNIPATPPPSATAAPTDHGGGGTDPTTPSTSPPASPTDHGGGGTDPTPPPTSAPASPPDLGGGVTDPTTPSTSPSDAQTDHGEGVLSWLGPL